MATLTVGTGEQYSTISAAVAASSSGDTINVDAGTYTNDFPTISHDLTLQAVGGTVSMVATQAPANGKGIIDEGGSGVNVTITGFDISGAQVADGNGAGVRYEGGTLTLSGDTIHNNQDGLLANADPSGAITISGSTFASNGDGDGATHNIYVGDVASLTVQNSTISGAVAGHEIKSRAQSTTITNNLIEDGPTGTASYEIDLPNGGNATITGNVIEKGPNAQNPVAITSGEEGNVYANSSLTVQGNTMLNDDTAHSTTAVVNDTGATATITGNSLYGWTTVSSGLASVSGNTFLTSEPALSSLSPGATTTSTTGSTDTSTSSATGTTATGTTRTDTTTTGATTIDTGTSTSIETTVASGTTSSDTGGAGAVGSLAAASGAPLDFTGSSSQSTSMWNPTTRSSNGQHFAGAFHAGTEGAASLIAPSTGQTGSGMISYAAS